MRNHHIAIIMLAATFAAAASVIAAPQNIASGDTAAPRLGVAW